MTSAQEIEFPQVDLSSPDRFINRELSWLAFNQRVLEESLNRNHPLLERLRFLSISASNLDEFYMVRVAGLKAQVRAGVTTLSADNLSPAQQLAAVNQRVIELMRDQQNGWRTLRQELREAGITVVDPSELTDTEIDWLEVRFLERYLPDPDADRGRSGPPVPIHPQSRLQPRPPALQSRPQPEPGRAAADAVAA